MAKKQITVCDRCAEGQDVLSVDTVTFATAEGSYQADLCETHLVDYQKFEEELAEWTKSARLITPAAASSPRPPRRRRPSNATAENVAIRAWCRSEGIEISERGRISDDLRQRWRDQQGQSAGNRWEHAQAPPTPAPAAATG